MRTAPADPKVNQDAARRIGGQWARALDEYAHYLAEGEKLAASTIGTRIRVLRSISSTLGLGPWAVDDASVRRWLDARQLSRETRRSYRKGLRMFYRWAVAVGRVDRQPIAEGAQRLPREPSPAWLGALDMWRIAESQRGIGDATLRTRGKHLRRFADECGVSSPWNVEPAHVLAWTDGREVAAGTAEVGRASLRAFYRWADKAGYVASDPTSAPSRRATTVRASTEWEDALAEWRRHMLAESKPNSTIELRLTHVRRFARAHEHLGSFGASTGDLLDWLAHKRWAPDTRRSVRSSLRAYFRWAKAAGHVSKSPAAKLPPVASANHQARPASDADYRGALAVAGRTDRLALRLAAELGMRRAEVAQVHTSDLRDTEVGVLLVVHGKGRRDRVLPVPESLAGVLRTVPAGYVFPGQVGGHVSPAWLGKRLSALLPSGVTMHMLRHRFATAVYAVDRDVLTVQQLLGHASPATTQRYVAVTTDRMRQLVEAIAS